MRPQCGTSSTYCPSPPCCHPPSRSGIWFAKRWWVPAGQQAFAKAQFAAYHLKKKIPPTTQTANAALPSSAAFWHLLVFLLLIPLISEKLPCKKTDLPNGRMCSVPLSPVRVSIHRMPLFSPSDFLLSIQNHSFCASKKSW